jgi:L-alanine-DL-glutamate epimerase-like enolase superfamily enzyme
MKIVRVSAIPMSAPVPKENCHRTDLGTKVKSDATLIRVETDDGLTGIGAALGTPPIVAAIIEHELAPEVVGDDPMFSERIYEKMYNGSRSRPALDCGVTQADENRRGGVIMEAIASVDIAVWDAKAQALGAELGARLCRRRLGAGRAGRVGTRGLCGRGLHRRQDRGKGAAGSRSHPLHGVSILGRDQSAQCNV